MKIRYDSLPATWLVFLQEAGTRASVNNETTFLLLYLTPVKPGNVSLQLVVASGDDGAADLSPGQGWQGPGHCLWKPSLFHELSHKS